MKRLVFLAPLLLILVTMAGCALFNVNPPVPTSAVRQLTSGDFRDLSPDWSPDGSTIIFYSTRDNRISQPPRGELIRDIYAVNPTTKEVWQVTDNRCGGQYDSGFVYPKFLDNSTILVYEMNWIHEYMRVNIKEKGPVTRHKADGTEDHFYTLLYIPGGYGGDYITASSDGKDIVWRARVTPNSYLPEAKWQLRTAPISELKGQSAFEAGTLLFETLNDGNISGISFSPDGKRLVFSAAKDNFVGNGVGEDLFILNLDSKQITQITFSGAQGVRNIWPDWGVNNKIVFSSNINGNQDIYLINSDGSDLVRLTDNPAQDIRPSWSPDSTKIVFSSNRGNEKYFNLYIMYPTP